MRSEKWEHGKENGEEDYQGAAVDDGRCPHVEDAKLARGKTKTTVIARTLKRTLGATKQRAMRLGVTLGGSRGKRTG
jgi:hypothetical protein